MTDALFDLVDDDAAPAATSTDAGPHLAGQWRLAEVQVANWGTFDASIYRMPVSRRGHLLTGPSGSGKSSLLDAIATVLTPGRFLRFNEAAQGGRSRANQRSVVSYVRGAWSRQNDEVEDRVVAAYLRPTSTWSGIVLRFEDGLGAHVTAARLFFLRGTSTSSTDLSDLCLLERSAVDLDDLQEYARTGIETRRAKARWPQAVLTTGGNHGTFYTRLCATLGIATEQTLRLLHKTQSAKSLDNLDDLFRSYMLDEPRTFEIARDAVEQFGELDDSHKHVVRLREQRDHLRTLEEAVERYARAEAAQAAAARLTAAVPSFQKHRELTLTRTDLTHAAEDAAVAASAAARAEDDLRVADQRYDDARARLTASGGDQVARFQERLDDAHARTRLVTERRDWFVSQLAAAGVTSAPADERSHAELLTEITRLAQAPEVPGPSHEELARLHRAADRVAAVEGEIAALRRSRTTVPSALLAVRDEIADATCLPTDALPFAAELVEVRPEHAGWTGAIERVLRPFALTMLVRSEHLAAVRRWVDTHHVGARLVFEEVPHEVGTPRPLRSDLSLVRRLTVADGTYGAWVAVQLAERFDLACVEDADALDGHERAVTRAGQIRTSRTRYEKDDRVALDDRSRWVLGDREAKLEALVTALGAARSEHTAALHVVEDADRRRAVALTRSGTLSVLRGIGWTEIDVATVRAHAERISAQIEALTSSSGELAAATAAVDESEAARVTARTAATRAQADHANAQARVAELERDLARLADELATGAYPELDDEVSAELDRRFRARRRKLDRSAIYEVGQQVLDALTADQRTAAADGAAAARDGESAIVRFVDRWPAAARDLTSRFEDRAGYLELLATIVANGLPDHEGRFLRLLRERSRDLVGHLVSEITGAMREIEEKLDDVNASLRRSPFETARYLRLRPKQLRSPSVTQFVADLRSISEDAWSDDDVTSAERRFATLAEIMATLASSDHHETRLRQQWLDTRLHVTFLAEEVDEHGRVHATYDSGAAMSGGQQQKLVVFCLAAALRYQLADAEQTRPRYGTVIFDEAFDKADSRYTRMALDVFQEFGFQLVLATPQKLLQTIEPYVGALTNVENPTRRRSVLSTVDWDGAPVAAGGTPGVDDDGRP